MQEGEYVAALQTVGTIPQEHPKLREKQVSEKQRMEALITFLQGIGRGLCLVVLPGPTVC